MARRSGVILAHGTGTGSRSHSQEKFAEDRGLVLAPGGGGVGGLTQVTLDPDISSYWSA